MRNVIVTGGSRGLGLAISSALVADGYNVVAVARTESIELRGAIEDARGSGKGALCFRPCDLSHTSDLARFVGTLRKEFGAIYGLVNNAGIGPCGILTMMRDKEVEALVRLNTISPLLMTKYVLRSMMVERAGRIINMASIVATVGYSGLSAYSTTKAAIVGFTRSLAREVGPLNITVNAVAPGFIDTELTRTLRDEQREHIVRRSALRRLATADDVGAAVTYLMSDKACNVTGVTLRVDAGNIA